MARRARRGQRRLRGGDLRIGSHVLAEVFAILTAGQVEPRASRHLVAQALAGLPGQPLTLSTEGHLRVLRRCADKGLMRATVYDALIAATALRAGAKLISRDRPAARTYTAVGVD